MTSLKLPRMPSFRSSRIRSKMTMVSLVEKPIIVKTAATVVALNSRVFNACFGEGAAQFGVRHPLLEGERGGIAAQEVHAKSIFPAMKPITDSDENQQPGHDEGGLGQFHEIEFRGPNDVEHGNR